MVPKPGRKRIQLTAEQTATGDSSSTIAGNKKGEKLLKE